MLINAVAPFAGAWIEMFFTSISIFPPMLSLPSRERGLKFIVYFYENMIQYNVAPFAGAWIEIFVKDTTKSCGSCRSLRGSVDLNID